MKNNIETGKIGENIAQKHLRDNKYLILGKNHKEKYYEIDIIARNTNGTLIFCEVKTMNREGINIDYKERFMPEDHLDRSKYLKLSHAAELFLFKNPRAVTEGSGWQIDLIAVELNNGVLYDLRHYENI